MHKFFFSLYFVELIIQKEFFEIVFKKQRHGLSFIVRTATVKLTKILF